MKKKAKFFKSLKNSKVELKYSRSWEKTQGVVTLPGTQSAAVETARGRLSKRTFLWIGALKMSHTDVPLLISREWVVNSFTLKTKCLQARGEKSGNWSDLRFMWYTRDCINRIDIMGARYGSQLVKASFLDTFKTSLIEALYKLNGT